MDSILPVVLVRTDEAPVNHCLRLRSGLRSKGRRAWEGSLLARVLVKYLTLDFTMAIVLALLAEGCRVAEYFFQAGGTTSSIGTFNLMRGLELDQRLHIGAVGRIQVQVGIV